MPYLPERSSTQTATDRRRPGRVETDNPHLIALFRNPWSATPTPVDEAADRIAPAMSDDVEDDDPLASARGILSGLLIGITMWAAIGVGAWYLL
jgi:hypothetical protein